MESKNKKIINFIFLGQNHIELMSFNWHEYKNAISILALVLTMYS